MPKLYKNGALCTVILMEKQHRDNLDDGYHYDDMVVGRRQGTNCSHHMRQLAGFLKAEKKA